LPLQKSLGKESFSVFASLLLKGCLGKLVLLLKNKSLSFQRKKALGKEVFFCLWQGLFFVLCFLFKVLP
jgi:hypothetical protein